MYTYTNHYIAFLDILGFKNLISSHDCDEIRSIFNMIMQVRETIEIGLHRACDLPEEEDNAEERVDLQEAAATLDGDCKYSNDELQRYNQALADMNIQIMSDSIIVATPATCGEALAVIIDACRLIQYFLYSNDMPLLLRGAIAKGKYYHEGEMMFGPGMTKAYLVQEHYSVYPRIIVAEKLLQEAECSFVWNCYEERVIRKSEDAYFYLDCLHFYLEEFLDKAGFMDKCERIEALIDDNLEDYSDDHIRDKYIWLRKEYERCVRDIEREHGWLCA